jgi:hypothetical protein
VTATVVDTGATAQIKIKPSTMLRFVGAIVCLQVMIQNTLAIISICHLWRRYKSKVVAAVSVLLIVEPVVAKSITATLRLVCA